MYNCNGSQKRYAPQHTGVSEVYNPFWKGKGDRFHQVYNFDTLSIVDDFDSSRGVQGFSEEVEAPRALLENLNPNGFLSWIELC